MLLHLIFLLSKIFLKCVNEQEMCFVICRNFCRKIWQLSFSTFYPILESCIETKHIPLQEYATLYLF